MRPLVVAAAALIASCGASSAAPRSSNPSHARSAPITAPAPASPLDPAMEAIIQAHAGGLDWTIVPLAQVQCGARSIAVVWPAIDRSGRVVDDDIVGFAFERDASGAPMLVESNFLIRSPEIEQCRGAPVSIRRGSAGLPRAVIADAFLSRLRAVQRAAAAHDRAGFRDAVLLVAECFDDAALFEALTDALSELVQGDIAVLSARITPEGIRIAAREDDGVEEVTLPVVPVPGRGDAVVISLER